jgi:protein-disulfide isomerase
VSWVWARLGPRARVLIPAAVAVGVLVVLAFGSLSGGSAPKKTVGAPPAATPTPAGTPTVAGPPPPKDDPALWRGSNSAPVTVVEFGDYQCPSCGAFAGRTEPELRRRYVDTGIVRFVWRDFPWIGKESTRAAIAARAAGRQGKFWPFHDALYAHQFGENSGGLTDAYLRGIAQRLGLDLARYDADRRDPALGKDVQAEYDFGQAIGVPGTPAFLINGTPFFGQQSLKAFVAAIEKARKER